MHQHGVNIGFYETAHFVLLIPGPQAHEKDDIVAFTACGFAIRRRHKAQTPS